MSLPQHTIVMLPEGNGLEMGVINGVADCYLPLCCNAVYFLDFTSYFFAYY